MSTVDLVWWSVGAAATASALACQFARWLRVLQREKYRPGSVLRFYARWAFPVSASANAVSHSRNLTSTIFRTPFTAASAIGTFRTKSAGYRPDPKARKTPRQVSFTLVMAVVVALTIASKAYPLTLAFTVLYGWVFPWGLALRGRTSPFAWTLRSRAVAAVSVVLLAVLGGALWGHLDRLIIGAVVIAATPVAITLAAVVTSPIGARVRSRTIAAGRARLAEVHPTVVVVTGAFGKSWAVHLLSQLLEGRSGTVTLSRRCDRLEEVALLATSEIEPWTTTVIVELGAVEQRAVELMVDCLGPSVAIVTGAGPSYLDVLRTVDAAEDAIWTPAGVASTVVVNVDDPSLARRARDHARSGQVVYRAGRDEQCDVAVTPTEDERWRVRVDGTEIGTMPMLPGGAPTVLACAIAGARALGQSRDVIASRLATLTPRPPKSTSTTTPAGLTVIVDLKCSTPAEATTSLRSLRWVTTDGRKVVVTPGLIHLGTSQGFENYRVGALIAQAEAELVAVARTNAEALIDGYGGHAHRVDTRDEAVTWVRENLHAGDVVVYLNDLPDHYP